MCTILIRHIPAEFDDDDNTCKFYTSSTNTSSCSRGGCVVLTVIMMMIHVNFTLVVLILVVVAQAWESRMENLVEKWGPGGRRRPSVGVEGGTPPVGIKGQSPLKLFNKNKT